MVKKKNVVETHGCIVCARLFNVLAVYSPKGVLVDCTVTSSGGGCVPDLHQPLVACHTHSVEEIESAYKKWLSRNIQEADDEQRDK